MHTRNRHPGRCWVDREHTCAENGTLDHVGIANADGVVVDIYQCSVCHEIWLEPRQFHPHGGPMTLPRPEAA